MKDPRRYLLPLLLCSLLLQGCGSDSDNTATTTSQYLWNGVTCTDSLTGVAVDASLCGATTTTSSQYVWNGVTCTDSYSGIAVDPGYCGYNSTTTTTTGYSSYNGLCYSYNGQIVDPMYCGQAGYQYQNQQCYGSFLSQYGSLIQCSGYNCSGQIVYHPTTLQTLYCP